MARAAFDDYLKEILHQRAICEKKPVVRKIYPHRLLVPAFGFPALLKLEDTLTRPFAERFTGMHFAIVLEKV